jgi:hypothetical protein
MSKVPSSKLGGDERRSAISAGNKLGRHGGVITSAEVACIRR